MRTLELESEASNRAEIASAIDDLVAAGWRIMNRYRVGGDVVVTVLVLGASS